jgi:hypothetical protein
LNREGAKDAKTGGERRFSYPLPLFASFAPSRFKMIHQCA